MVNSPSLISWASIYVPLGALPWVFHSFCSWFFAPLIAMQIDLTSFIVRAFLAFKVCFWLNPPCFIQLRHVTTFASCLLEVEWLFCAHLSNFNRKNSSFMLIRNLIWCLSHSVYEWTYYSSLINLFLLIFIYSKMKTIIPTNFLFEHSVLFYASFHSVPGYPWQNR